MRAVEPATTLTSIAVTPAGSTIPVGTTLQLTATGVCPDRSTRNLTNQVSWRSSNPAVATVNAGGLATGVAAGSSTITAASGTVTGTTGLRAGGSTQGHSLTITMSGTGSGTVGSSPAGTSCGADYLQRHSFTALSSVPAVAKTAPSGEKSKGPTPPVCATSVCKRAPDWTSHSPTEP